jgi:hypothetical protein
MVVLKVVLVQLFNKPGRLLKQGMMSRFPRILEQRTIQMSSVSLNKQKFNGILGPLLLVKLIHRASRLREQDWHT